MLCLQSVVLFHYSYVPVVLSSRSSMDLRDLVVLHYFHDTKKTKRRENSETF